MAEGWGSDGGGFGLIRFLFVVVDQTEVLHLLESPDALKSKVAEAIDVLRNVQQANSPSSHLLLTKPFFIRVFIVKSLVARLKELFFILFISNEVDVVVAIRVKLLKKEQLIDMMLMEEEDEDG
ncbi:polyadenylate-binding protein [Tanacetum coccineum]